MLLMCVPSVPEIMLQEHLVLTGHKISNLQPQNVWEWNMKCVLVKGFATITFSWELRLFFFAAARAFCLNCSNCWQIRSFHPISPRSLSPWLGWDKTEEMDGGVVEEDDEGDDGEPALAVVLLPPLQHWARSPLLLTLLQTWQSITCIYPVYKVEKVLE